MLIDRRGARSSFGSVTRLALAGVLGLAGCHRQGEGTVQVSPEARARLTPRVSATARGPKNRLVGERPIGIKDRGPSGTTTP
jgi:hypothetical protein